MSTQGYLSAAREALTGRALKLNSIALHIVLVTTSVASAVVLLGSPKFSAYALWTFVDTGDLVASFVIGATVIVVFWIGQVGAARFTRTDWLPALATLIFPLWQAFDFYRGVHVTRYVQRIPATWALTVALVAGMAAAFGIVWSIAQLVRRLSSVGVAPAEAPH